MLREMARRVDQLSGKFQRKLEAAIFQIEVQLFGLLLGHAVGVPAPDHAGQRTCHILRQPKRLADLAHRAPRAVAGDDGGQGRTGPAIGLVNPLDDLFAPLVLEIHIDVRRLAALLADEALE
jgi:hypothetical protein